MNDDELLDVLTRAFQASPAEPSQVAIDRLRQRVSNQPTVHGGVTRRRRIRRRVVVITTAVVLVGSTSMAYAASVDALPPAVRSAARAVGLPVESNDLADTRSAETDLRIALASGDARTIAGAADHLDDRLRHLTPEERARAPEAIQLLATARNAAHAETTNTSSSTTSSTTTTSIQLVTPSGPVATTESHGGDAPETPSTTEVPTTMPVKANTNDESTDPTPPTTPGEPATVTTTPPPTTDETDSPPTTSQDQ